MKTKLTSIYFILGMLTYIPNIVFSQNLSRDTISLDEVVVTGSKIEVARKLVPVSVSKISEKEIENTGEINVLPTLSTCSPGVFVTERNVLGFGVSTGGSGAISIRGISGSPNTNVLVLIDGHPQYQGIFGHPLPDAYVASDVEKVEIIRGPASILYGSNAMGGVVNIITKQQHNNGLNGNAMASYGSYNTQKYSGTIGYKKNKFSVFTSVNHNKTDGIRENTDYKITNAYIKLQQELNDHIKIIADFSTALFNANDNGSIYEEPAPFGIDITRGKTAFSIENNYQKINGALKLYHNFGTHDLSDGWHSTDRNSGLMLYQTLKLFEGNRLTSGIDLKQYGGKGNSGMASDSMITINEIAFYAYMQQKLFNKISISTGLRIENNSIYGNELVPMFGINYNPGNTTTIKSSVSKGFRNPTGMEMYLFAPNPELKPEEMVNFEVGWLQSYLSDRLQTELTLFAAEGKNMIQVVGQYPKVKRQNVGTFSNKGIEIALKYRATKNFYFNTNYSYLSLDKVVLAAPKHQFNFSANYSTKQFDINISTQHINKLYTSTKPEIKTSYTLLNARINARVVKNVNVFLMANNLMNREYEINYGYPMPGINFSAGANFKF